MDKLNLISVLSHSNVIESIAVDDNQTIYYTTGYSGVWKLDYSSLENRPQPLFQATNTDAKGIAYYADNIFICSWNQHCILQYSLQSQLLYRVTGGTEGYKDGSLDTARFSHPWEITCDRNGILYVTDRHHVRRIDIQNDTVETIAGCTIDPVSDSFEDGFVETAKLKHPSGIKITHDGSIYVCDTGNYCIRKIKDDFVWTVAGNQRKKGTKEGSLEQSRFVYLWNLLVLEADNRLLVIDQAVRSVDFKSQTVSTVAHFVDYKPLSIGADSYTFDIVIATQNNFIFLQYKNACWKWERFLWIGHMKENSKECPFARVPRDIIKEIASHLIPLRKRKRPSNKRKHDSSQASTQLNQKRVL